MKIEHSESFLRHSFPALINLINTLDFVIHEPLYSHKLVESGHWDYVSYNNAWFLHHLDESLKILKHCLPKRQKFRFVDVGCGIGTKVSLASHFFDANGIELGDRYAKMAKEIAKKRRFHNYGRHDEIETEKAIYKEDALAFPHYHRYDVIYFFRPMSNDKMQMELENKIYNDARPGAIIIPIFAIGQRPKYIRKLKTPSEQIHIKLRCKTKFQKLNEEVQALL